MLVWIDAREAIIVRMQADQARIERVVSDVPAHHRATGHVRHDPGVRHGGGGPQAAGESHRLEHLTRFVGEVADRLATDAAVLVLGPGTVPERLARQLSESDQHHGRHRVVDYEAAPRLTDRQLITRLRRFSGGEPRRRSVGAYRWTDAPGARRPGQAYLPRRVVSKPAHEQPQPVAEE
jgi:hypothetical protein